MATDPASSVYAPRGALIAGPLAGGEGILYADLDLSAGAWAGLVNRQYDRPDLFHVTVDRSTRQPALAFTEVRAPAAAGPSADLASEAGGDELEARARRLIDDRYGSQLAGEDRERLVPFVVRVLETSARLEEHEPSTIDPTTTRYADDAPPAS
jgi:hypothetical protein